MIELEPAFEAKHPLRLDLPDGYSLRFRDYIGAAKSAIHHHCGLWDEANGRGISLADCRRIANEAETRRAVA